MQDVLTQMAMQAERHTHTHTHSLAFYFTVVLHCFVVVRKLAVTASSALQRKRTAVVFVMEMDAPVR